LPNKFEEEPWLDEAAGFLKLSGMMTELPQYGHLAVLSPAGGSTGPPQLGHLINFKFIVLSGMGTSSGWRLEDYTPMTRRKRAIHSYYAAHCLRGCLGLESGKTNF
jgi:hypothetical protein